jgi:hypothetical protein
MLVGLVTGRSKYLTLIGSGYAPSPVARHVRMAGFSLSSVGTTKVRTARESTSEWGEQPWLPCMVTVGNWFRGALEKWNPVTSSGAPFICVELPAHATNSTSVPTYS